MSLGKITKHFLLYFCGFSNFTSFRNYFSISIFKRSWRARALLNIGNFRSFICSNLLFSYSICLRESQRVSASLSESQRVSASLSESQRVSASLSESQRVSASLSESQRVSTDPGGPRRTPADKADQS